MKRLMKVINKQQLLQELLGPFNGTELVLHDTLNNRPHHGSRGQRRWLVVVSGICSCRGMLEGRLIGENFQQVLGWQLVLLLLLLLLPRRRGQVDGTVGRSCEDIDLGEDVTVAVKGVDSCLHTRRTAAATVVTDIKVDRTSIAESVQEGDVREKGARLWWNRLDQLDERRLCFVLFGRSWKL